MVKKNNEYVVFILTYGRSKKVHTYDTIRKQGYRGKIYLVCSDDDSQVNDYKKNFPNEVVVFNKQEYANTFDIGDNFNDNRVVVFARNATMAPKSRKS